MRGSSVARIQRYPYEVRECRTKKQIGGFDAIVLEDPDAVARSKARVDEGVGETASSFPLFGEREFDATSNCADSVLVE